MIYEFRSYVLKVGSMGKFEENFANALPIREKHSKLTACWHTEIGPLNQIIHVWAYEDMKHRAEVRAAAAAEPGWPPPGDDEHIVKMETEIVIPAPFQKPIEPGHHGNFFEMRYYDALPNSMPEIMDVWGAKLPGRLKYSPLFFCGYTEVGTLNRLIHIWAYEDMKQRSEIRAAAVAAGDWPPATGKFLVTMNNKIMVPSSFSPVH